MMLRTLITVVLIAFAGCTFAQRDPQLQTQSLTSAEEMQVNAVLEKLYQSFGYAHGEEPDWALMRSVFIEHAQFVTEPSAGEAPKSQTIDELISSWQASIRDSASPTVATEEQIIDTRMEKVGSLIRVDVVFRAKKGTDSAIRKPGLDSLVLVDTGGDWKILSFVVHYESKL